MLRRLLTALAVAVALFVALPSTAATPVLVIYPFATNGTGPEDMGQKLSARIADEIKALGGIAVVVGAASAKPADYRSAARAAGADVYFSGSIVPVAGSYSAIEQLVSTHSGVVVWSSSLQFRAVDDVTGQGAVVRNELLRSLATPSPNITVAAVDLITSPALSGLAVLPVTGSALDGDKAYAQRALVETLQHRGFKATPWTGTGSFDPLTNGVTLCATTGAQTLIAGALDTTRAGVPGAVQTTAHVSLQTYDCSKHALAQQATVVNHIEPIANDAIRGAIEDAVSAFPAPS
ncbi:MAG TPA: hypothetical protein VGP41_03335 [Candidatus Lustribacter sp.]|nr:hypothetical protein [Candidatus Lustribacter sp.]